MPSLQIDTFSEDNLSKLLYSQQYLLSPNHVPNDPHIIYLKEYLGNDGLGASYILTEPKYISRDYLDGFSSYYALSFQVPERDCKRLHFFNSPEPADTFRETLTQAILSTDSRSERFWQEAYLGFIVVKPLAVCNIGYTVLKHYNHNAKRPAYSANRSIWATKPYTCHLFGREITLDSLAFQEQDTNLAACASVAIWSMLQMVDQGQSMLRKSPGQITRDAGLTAHNGNRLFPNDGLSVEQICTAITANGLLTEVREFDEDDDGRFDMNRLRRLVDAYSGLKIPLILALAVPDDGDYYGHAVAIAGHETKPAWAVKQPVIDGLQPMLHRADGITKLYAHDDGWGCFARILIEESDEGLSSAWNLVATDDSMLCKPLSLIIPVPPKVRIPYEDIKAFVYYPDLLLKAFFNEAGRATVISWDIKLLYSETLKQHLAHLPYWADDSFSPLKMAILQTNMPKYIWVATCFWNNYETINFIFDATEMKNGLLGRHLIFHGYEEQQFVQQQIDALTPQQLTEWDIENDAYTDYCLHFMRQTCREFSVPNAVEP